MTGTNAYTNRIDQGVEGFRVNVFANYGEALTHRATNKMTGALAATIGRGGTHGNALAYGFGATHGPTAAARRLLQKVTIPFICAVSFPLSLANVRAVDGAGAGWLAARAPSLQPAELPENQPEFLARRAMRVDLSGEISGAV